LRADFSEVLKIVAQMSDWDDDDKPNSTNKTWGDEEEVPDSWDVDEKPVCSKPKQAPPPKMTAKEKMAIKAEKKNKVIAQLQKKQEDEARPLTELEREELSKEQECNLIMDSFGVSDAAPLQVSELDFNKVSTKQDFIDLSVKLVEKFKKLESKTKKKGPKTKLVVERSMNDYDYDDEEGDDYDDFL
uniref:Eukaryotic translation initiation factor 3 30 kDa subunit n=1 Tax=Hydatigena taeniaeformis TaxID=6205 RepID=A0A0R3WQK8_HYDTA